MLELLHDCRFVFRSFERNRSFFLLATATLANYIPARRAARIDAADSGLEKMSTDAFSASVGPGSIDGRAVYAIPPRKLPEKRSSP